MDCFGLGSRGKATDSIYIGRTAGRMGGQSGGRADSRLVRRTDGRVVTTNLFLLSPFLRATTQPMKSFPHMYTYNIHSFLSDCLLFSYPSTPPMTFSMCALGQVSLLSNRV